MVGSQKTAVHVEVVSDSAGGAPPSSSLHDWQLRMRGLAVVLLVTGLFWLAEALQKHMHPTPLLSSLVLKLPFLTASVRFSWSSLLLSVWTWGLLIRVAHLANNGKLKRPPARRHFGVHTQLR